MFLILTSGDLIVALSHGDDTILRVEHLGALELSVQQVDLALTEVLAVFLVLIFLTVDVVADIIDLMLALIDGSVQLHFLLGGVLQVLLQVGDLARQLALRGTILSILLLDLRQVLKLDRLSFEDASFHVFDKDLLFFAEEIVLELHSMDFLLHGDNLSLADGRVQSILHLFLELILALPQKDLLLSIDDVNENVTLLLLKLGNLVLQLNGLVFHLLELLLELHLDVEVVVCELLLSFIVLVDQVVKLVHLEDLIFLSDLKISNFLAVAIDLRIDSDLFLVQD